MDMDCAFLALVWLCAGLPMAWQFAWLAGLSMGCAGLAMCGAGLAMFWIWTGLSRPWAELGRPFLGHGLATSWP